MNSKGFSFIGTNKTCVNAFFVSNKEINKINLQIPRKNNLKQFTNSNIRESRSIEGNLNYISGENKLREISECEVVDLSSSDFKKEKIKNLI